MLQICNLIRKAREKKGLSQGDVAKEIGVKRSTYAEWETDTEPKASVFMKIAQVLEINPLDAFSSYSYTVQEKQQLAQKLYDIQSNLDALKEMLLPASGIEGLKSEVGDDEHVAGERIVKKSRSSGKQYK